jgi:hypothetical protein
MATCSEFVDVELADPTSQQSQFFIDSMSCTSFISIVSVLVVFIVVHVVAAFRAPPIRSFKNHYFPLNLLKSDRNATLEIDLTLSLLQALHRSIEINCSLLKESTSSSESAFDLNVSMLARFAQNVTFLSSTFSEPRAVTVIFPRDSAQSSFFSILRRGIDDFDSISLKVSMTSNFEAIQGFMFRWSFVDPSARTYAKSAFYLMSGLVAYMLLVFAFSLQFDIERFTTYFCVVLGIAGILAPNPLRLIVDTPAWLDALLISSYIGVFRLFCLAQLEMIARGTSAPNAITFSVLIAYFVYFAAFGSDDGTGIALLTYSAISAAHIAAACACSRGMATRRLFLFALLLAADVCAGWTVRGGEFVGSIVQEMLKVAVPMTGGAFAVFLLHTGAEPQYRKMDGAENGADTFTVEEILSRDGGEDGFPEEVHTSSL